MLGDSISDVTAARAAGFDIICMSNGYNHGNDIGDENPDIAEPAVIESLRGAFLIMGTVGVIFACFSQYIIPLFTNDESNSVISSIFTKGQTNFLDNFALPLTIRTPFRYPSMKFTPSICRSASSVISSIPSLTS